MPELQALSQARPDVRVVAVNVGEPPEQIQPWLAACQLDLPVLLDAEGRVAALDQLRGQPSTFVIGADGTILSLIDGRDHAQPDRTVAAARLMTMPTDNQPAELVGARVRLRANRTHAALHAALAARDYDCGGRVRAAALHHAHADGDRADGACACAETVYAPSAISSRSARCFCLAAGRLSARNSQGRTCSRSSRLPAREPEFLSSYEFYYRRASQ
jgi:hypothetical protein